MYALARIAIAAIVAIAATWTMVEPVSAQSGTRTPLLMEKKKTLFQRVLTRPEARLHDKPGGTAGATLRMYVEAYEPDASRQDRDAADALADLVAAGIALAQIRERTGREGPTVVT